METNLCVAGFGGQGVMTLGKFLASATCDATNKNVTFFPSYGAEQRGGTANCFVVISDEEIGAPLGDVMDDLIVMNGPSLKKFLPTLKKGGTLVNLSAYFSNASIPIQPAVWGFGYGDKTIKGVGCGGGRLLLSRMAQLIASGRVQPEKLITHRYHGMEQIPEAMGLFLNHDRSLIKPVIYND